MPPPFYAHSGDRDNFSDWQLLNDHLIGVARLARSMAQGARPSDAALDDAAYAAGLLHDLGKYRPEFQLMIRGLQPRNEKTYHKQAGAAKAADTVNLPVSFAIAGHHGGIPDTAGLKGAVTDPSGRAVAAAIWDKAVLDCPDLAAISSGGLRLKGLDADLITRLIFSCLVDADWTDTGEHERRVKGLPAEPLAPDLQPAARLERVLDYIRRRAEQCRADAPAIALLRQEVLDACLAAATNPPGLFSLTVPTGGGKTLSGLAFALKQAAAHGLRRVIYVAPYLTILDQNARVIREALGVERDDPAVFEHHSLAEPPGDEDDNDTKREAAARRAENWDAPIVITTNVQFFESLFSNKPGRCRKLHNIARSVILLDECQTLPPDLVAPTCSMLGQLASSLGCTIILCTATQPAFAHDDLKQHERLPAREIIPESLDLFSRLRRVHVKWPPHKATPLDWPTVAGRMGNHRASLCIVNTRRAARELFTELKKLGDAVFHLSTLMCPAHRLAVLDEVKRRLDGKESCYLVSTQLIEAGVDVDFPFLMRELAPLEAIIQAAGRCNREGKLNAADGSPGGRVEVFRSAAALREPFKYYPPDPWYLGGRKVLENDFLNDNREPRVDAPEDIKEYFERLYRTGQLDAFGIQAARQRFAFKEVGTKYRLIDDDGDAVVVATWEERRGEIEVLVAAAVGQPTRSNFRRLAPYQVNLRGHDFVQAAPVVRDVGCGLLVWRDRYHADIGVSAE
jgi:CRISPR-associated endonuclease/helicase Cas3